MASPPHSPSLASELSPLLEPSRGSLSKSTQCATEGSLSLNHQRSNQKDIGIDTSDGEPDRYTPEPLEVSFSTMSTKQEWMAIIACFWCFFLGGWYDASTGPLLPTIQAHYAINFTVVSMLFVSNCVGFVSAAVINIYTTDRLGFGKVLFLGALVQVFAYAILVPAPPFPVMCMAFAMSGFGGALQDAQANGFVAGLKNNASAKMGLLHALYGKYLTTLYKTLDNRKGTGAGAFVAPFVATQFAPRRWWSFHYLTTLALAVSNALVILVVFRLRRQHDIMGLPDPSTLAEESHSSDGTNKYREIFSSRKVQFMAFFILIYVGVEVSMGGWIVTFAIDERGGGHSAGYISSGFFGGLMLGRVALLWINEKIGERRVIYVYCILCIGLELVIWLVPNLVANAIAVSIVGLLLGECRPFYPIAMNIMGVIVPQRILTQSIGWVASFGQAGSAVFPFMTGALAQKHGVKVLHPLLIAMILGMILIWALIPTNKERDDDSPESQPLVES